MSTQLIDQFNKAGKTSFTSARALYDINAGMVEQLAEQQLAWLNLGLEFTTRQVKSTEDAKGYKEYLSSQGEIITDTFNKAQGITRNTVDIINESKDELTAWFDNGVKEAEKGIKEASKSVTSPVKKSA